MNTTQKSVKSVGITSIYIYIDTGYPEDCIGNRSGIITLSKHSGMRHFGENSGFGI